MSCEDARAQVEQEWRAWQIALDSHISLINRRAVTVVDMAGDKALEEARQKFEAADERFLAAVRVHLAASSSHRPPPTDSNRSTTGE